MTSVKDKLSASLRQVRSERQPVAGDVAGGSKTATTVKAKPNAAAKAAPKPVPPPVKPSGDVQPSGGALFPSRVWPD